MKKLLFAGVAVAALCCAPALAADIPVKAPVYKAAAAPIFDWTGPYAGIAAGWGWGHSKQTDPGIEEEIGDGSYRLRGGLIGGTLGYNWQRGPWVFGLEADYSWADIKGHSDTCGPAPGHPCGTKLQSFGTARARIGNAMGAALPYITGGLAFGDVHGWDSLTPASGSKVYVGWTVGAGIEWKLPSNWSAKIEYLYADLGKHHLFDIVPGPPPVPETVSVNVNIVRVGLNYKFGSVGR